MRREAPAMIRIWIAGLLFAGAWWLGRWRRLFSVFKPRLSVCLSVCGGQQTLTSRQSFCAAKLHLNGVNLVREHCVEEGSLSQFFLCESACCFDRLKRLAAHILHLFLALGVNWAAADRSQAAHWLRSWLGHDEMVWIPSPGDKVLSNVFAPLDLWQIFQLPRSAASKAMPGEESL